MKSIIFLLIFYQSIALSQDTINIQSVHEFDSIPVQSKVETVKVFIKEKEYSPKPGKFIEISEIEELLQYDSFSIFIKAGILILILLLIGFLNYKIYSFFKKYNFAVKYKRADELKILIHILLWIIALGIILSLFAKKSFLMILLIFFVFAILLIVALKDLFKNILAGIIILFEKPFSCDDWIRVGQYYGKVHSKNLRDVEIITEDDSIIRIPNSVFITEPFENVNIISKNKQVNFSVEIPPVKDIRKTKSILQEVVSLSSYNSINKPVEVIYKGLNDRGLLEFQIKAYVFEARYENEFKSDVKESIAEIFGYKS